MQFQQYTNYKNTLPHALFQPYLEHSSPVLPLGHQFIQPGEEYNPPQHISH